MNAATRVLSQGIPWEQSYSQTWQISWRGLMLILCLLAVLASALSIVYVRSLQRDLYNQLESTHQISDHLQMERSQLMLEENTWAAPIRIQTLAQEELGMHVAPPKETILLIAPH